MIDYTKPLTTRCGYEVNIWTHSPYGKHTYSVKGEYFDGESWQETSWTIDGIYSLKGGETGLDLINPPEEIERWININGDKELFMGGIYTNKDDADKYASERRIACIKVKFKEGDGL